jgi:hypothetical protein
VQLEAFLHAAFLHAAFLHAAFLHAAFLHAAFLHAAFLHAAFLHTEPVSTGLGVTLSLGRVKDVGTSCRHIMSAHHVVAS